MQKVGGERPGFVARNLRPHLAGPAPQIALHQATVKDDFPSVVPDRQKIR